MRIIRPSISDARINEIVAGHHASMLLAANMHKLRLVFETRNMMIRAEMELRASLMRTECRCSHCRLELPDLDDKNRRVCINITKEADGTIQFETHSIIGQRETALRPAIGIAIFSRIWRLPASPWIALCDRQFVPLYSDLVLHRIPYTVLARGYGAARKYPKEVAAEETFLRKVEACQAERPPIRRCQSGKGIAWTSTRTV